MNQCYGNIQSEKNGRNTICQAEAIKYDSEYSTRTSTTESNGDISLGKSTLDAINFQLQNAIIYFNCTIMLPKDLN